MYDIIVIGGGTAGLSAAISSGRSGAKILVIDKGPEFGTTGLLASAGDFPGITDNINGIDFLNRMKKQAETFGVEIKKVSATSVNLAASPKKVTTNEPATYESKNIILATGNTPHQSVHNYPGEEKFVGKGVSHDIEADSALCKHAAVALLGKTSSTAENAIYLSNFAEKIYWIIPASKLDLPDELKERLEKIKRIEIFYSSSLKQINGTNEVTSITLLAAGHEKHLNVKFVFLPHQNHKPVTDYLSGTGIQINNDGCILVTNDFETSVKGVYAAGNILCTKNQMTVVCAAQGTIAGINAARLSQ